MSHLCIPLLMHANCQRPYRWAGPGAESSCGVSEAHLWHNDTVRQFHCTLASILAWLHTKDNATHSAVR